MQDSDIFAWLWFLFPLAFIGIWLALTTALGVFSGWNVLQDRYPDRDFPALRTLRFQSGKLGRVDFNSCLTLSATRFGVRIAAWRIFAPFQSPILVPWSDIDASPGRVLLFRTVRLGFGKPEIGRLTVSTRTWQRLVEASPSADARLRTRA